MDELIERLENAGGGLRELDIAIAACIGWKFHQRDIRGIALYIAPGDLHTQYLPFWTTSIDAALTLVSEGENIWWEIRQIMSSKSPMRNFGSYNYLFYARVGNNYGEDGFLGKHDIPALALCIAALKARQP